MNMLLAKTAAAPTAKNSFIFTVLGAKWGVLWLWLLIINVLALVVYGVDKVLAKIKEHAPKTRRIPEKTLLLLAALGGGGAFAYIKFIKPKQGAKVSADPDDYEFEDEEYENEDVPEQGEQEDQN